MALIMKKILASKTTRRLDTAIRDELANRDSRSGSLLVELMRSYFIKDTDAKEGEEEYPSPLEDFLFLGVIFDIFGDAPPEEWAEMWAPSAEGFYWDFSREALVFFLCMMRESWRTPAFLKVLETSGDFLSSDGTIYFDSAVPRRLRRLMGDEISSCYPFLKIAIECTPGFLDSEDEMVRYFKAPSDHSIVFQAVVEHFEASLTSGVMSAALEGMLWDSIEKCEIPSRLDGTVAITSAACAELWASLPNVPASLDRIQRLARLLDDKSHRLWVDYVTNDAPPRRWWDRENNSPTGARKATIEAVRQTLGRN